jgi:transcriptional regulator with XRE-family HTH domain
MTRKRKFSVEPFGPSIERLMADTGLTYRGLAAKTQLSAGYLNHLVHGNRPVPSKEIVERLAEALDIEPEHFREYRLRVITDRLEARPDMIDRLYKRLISA